MRQLFSTFTSSKVSAYELYGKKITMKFEMPEKFVLDALM